MGQSGLSFNQQLAEIHSFSSRLLLFRFGYFDEPVLPCLCWAKQAEMTADTGGCSGYVKPTLVMLNVGHFLPGEVSRSHLKLPETETGEGNNSMRPWNYFKDTDLYIISYSKICPLAFFFPLPEMISGPNFYLYAAYCSSDNQTQAEEIPNSDWCSFRSRFDSSSAQNHS